MGLLCRSTSYPAARCKDRLLSVVMYEASAQDIVETMTGYTVPRGMAVAGKKKLIY